MRPTTPQTREATTEIGRVHLSVGELDALRATRFAQRFPPHFHDTFAIGVIESGATVLRTPRGEWLGRAGTILAFCPGEVHSALPVDEGGWNYRMIYPCAETMAEMGIDVSALTPDHPLFATPVIEDSALANELLRAQIPLTAGQWDARVEGHLVDALRRLTAAHGVATRVAGCRRALDERVVDLTRRYMDEHFNETVRIRTLAELCGLSPFHVIRIFGRVVGVPPYAYLLQLRVNRAQAMLVRGASVADVTYACGFSDQSHFTRTFKKAVGVPPGQYMRSVSQPAA